jgi:hypothetical protein
VKLGRLIIEPRRINCSDANPAGTKINDISPGSSVWGRMKIADTKRDASHHKVLLHLSSVSGDTNLNETGVASTLFFDSDTDF